MRYVVFLIPLLIMRLLFFYLSPLQIPNGENLHFSTTLLESPVIKGGNQEFSVRIGTFWHGVRAIITTDTMTEYSYGQQIEVIGTATSKLLKNKKIILTIQNPEIKATNSGFLPFFGAIRQKIIQFCENNFSQPHSGMLVGIIFGMKNLLTDGITRSFRITGLSHIVAASGMNVTLTAGFLFGLFGLFLRRQEATVLSILGIFGYVMLSGFDPSIVRAALMGSVAFSANLLGRQYSGTYMLFLVAGSMLFVDPLLLTDVGFQLSVLATLGILVLKPVFFPQHFFGDDFGTTLAAQIATLPILLSVFGQYPLVSLPANILILWTIPFIMIVGGLGIIIGLLFEPLGALIVSLIIPLVWYLEQIAKFFSLHSASFAVENFSWYFIAAYYCLLWGILLFVKRKTL